MKIYGGLLFENLFVQDQYFDFQLFLLSRGLIDGLQVRVAHPSFTPGLSANGLAKVFSVLPKNCEVFIHFGADSVGCDLGQVVDLARYSGRKCRPNDHDWQSWNEQTLHWGLEVAKHVNGHQRPLGVLHAGNGNNEQDEQARDLIVRTLNTLPLQKDQKLAIEALPPIVLKSEWEKILNSRLKWVGRNYFWSFGNTPEDMKQLLSELNDNFLVLLDFTHLLSMINQAESLKHPHLALCRELERTLEQYRQLPLSRICHWSGISQYPVANHLCTDLAPPEPIKNFIKEMEVVCLETHYCINRQTEMLRRLEEFRHAIN